MSISLLLYGLQNDRFSCPSPSPRVCSNSRPLSRWCHPTVSSSVVLFSSCLQSFPASGSFPVSQLFVSGAQNTGASASVSVLLLSIQGWFPLRLTGLISLLSKGLSKIFFSITVWKHQFFSAWASLGSTSHTPTSQEKRPQNETYLAGTLTLDVLDSRTKRNKFLLFKSHSLWVFCYCCCCYGSPRRIRHSTLTLV